MGRQASFNFMVIKSTKEKSRENNKQTNNFLTKIEIKMSYLEFLFRFLLSLRLWSHLEAVLSTVKIT